MGATLTNFKRAKVMSVALAFACTVMASADSLQSQLPNSLPIAYTQYYCVYYESFCLSRSYVVTPYGQTEGPDDSSPSWSPDATRIAYVASGDIAVMDAAGGSVNITNTSSAEWFPAWSPDGQRIAFVSDRDGQFNLYVMEPDGTDVVRVTTHSAGKPTWSAGGTRLAYSCEVDGNLDICAINADGTGFVRLTDDPGQDAYPAWSPDGQTIAFATTRYGVGYQLAVMRPDGSGVSRIGNGVIGGYPAWSPDGSQIAFISGGNYGEFGIAIFTMRADGSNIRFVALDATEPAWVPLSPFASFSSACDGLTCTFDASQSIGTINTYTWKFGDQATGTGSVVSHTYADGGPFTIELTVTDAGGATATSRTGIYLNRPPVASFTVSCDDSLTCLFDGSASHDPDGSIDGYLWSFGDGTGVGGRLATHTYSSAGSFTVTLRVTDFLHASTTVNQTVTLATPVMHVGDLDGASSAVRGPWTATVTVEVHRANHSPIANAVVAASWNNGTTASCTTNTAGRCAISRSGIPPSKDASLNVTGVAHPVFVYSATANHDADGDSNGTAISIPKR